MPQQQPSKKLISYKTSHSSFINQSEYNSHTDPLFKISNILKLNDLDESQVVLFMHNFLHHKLPKSFDNSFKMN